MGRRGPMSDADKARLSRMLDEKYTYKDMASSMAVVPKAGRHQCIHRSEDSWMMRRPPQDEDLQTRGSQ